MPHIPHPARQGDTPSVADWLRFHLGTWMQNVGAELERRALYPRDVNAPNAASGADQGVTATTSRSDVNGK